MRIRSEVPGVRPLRLTHGWPGSVLKLPYAIEPVADPLAHGGSATDAFDLVIPSLPRFGFSEHPTGTGANLHRTARAWATLMRRLGHATWFAQGGDGDPAPTRRRGFGPRVIDAVPVCSTPSPPRSHSLGLTKPNDRTRLVISVAPARPGRAHRAGSRQRGRIAATRRPGRLLRTMAELDNVRLLLGHRGDVFARNALLPAVLGRQLKPGSSFTRFLFLDTLARERILYWEVFARAWQRPPARAAHRASKPFG